MGGSPLCSIANVLGTRDGGAMRGGLDSASHLSLRTAACMLSGDPRDPAAASACAVRSTCSCAGPASRRRTPTTCEPRSCWPCSARRRGAPPAARARLRPRVRDRAPQGDRPWSPARPRAARVRRRTARAGCGGPRPGSLADGLDEVTAAAHTRRVRADLVRASGRLDGPQRAAIAAHADGGAARGRASSLHLLSGARSRPGPVAQRSAGPPRRCRCPRRPRAARTRGAPARRGRARSRCSCDGSRGGHCCRRPRRARRERPPPASARPRRRGRLVRWGPDPGATTARGARRAMTST